jgi:hypothetical protein
MNTPALERTSAAKAGWLIIVLTVGWMAIVLWPGGPELPAAKPGAVPLPASSLTRAGLRENPDWEGLPEIFAIWADKADWKDNRTRFAYWHPVMKTYSYYFEAARSARGYLFREIAEPLDPVYFWDDSLGDECPIRFYLSRSVRVLNAPVRLPPLAIHTMEDMKSKPDVPVVVIPIQPVPKP